MNTFAELIAATLAVFPNAIVSEDQYGCITIEPGFFEVPGTGGELGTYTPEQ